MPNADAECRVQRCRSASAEGRTPKAEMPHTAWPRCQKPGAVGDEAMVLGAASGERERSNAPGGAGGKKTKGPPRRRVS